MSAYVEVASAGIVAIQADDSTDRRSRASQAGTVKRAYEREHNVTLTLVSTSYSETHGFLARSRFNYSVTRGQRTRGNARKR